MFVPYWIAAVLHSFILAAAVTSPSFLAGAFYANLHGPLKPDTYELEVIQKSLLVIVVMQFVLTGIAIAFLLRGRGMRIEIILLLLVPFLTFIVRHVNPSDIFMWLILSNWAVLWRIFIIRYARNS